MDSRISARALAAALGGWRTREPAYEALADGVRLLCLDGRIIPRTTLPAERELAAILGLSRSTVAAAYASLRATAHIASVRGSGSVTLAARGRQPGRIATRPDEIDLQHASLAAWPGLAGIMSEVAGDAAALVARPGYEVWGAPELRHAIAARYTANGVPTTAEEILVTTGAQAAIHLIAQTLTRRGDRALVETPTYPHAADALRSAGARLVGVPITTSQGWDLDRAEHAFARTTPRLAYLMPRLQNPTGRSMTSRDEATYVAAAARAGTVLVIDETTADLSFDPEADATSFRGADVVRIGSLSKTVWGGLRIGWVRAHRDLLSALLAARPARDLGTPEFEQAVATRVLGVMPEILRQRAPLLQDGHQALVSALRERLPQWRVPEVTGGVSLWVELDAPLSSGLVLAARDRDVYLSSGSRFAVDGAYERHLRLPFTAPRNVLRRSVDVLADVWPEVRSAAPNAIGDIVGALV